MEHVKTPVDLLLLADCADLLDSNGVLLSVFRSREVAFEVRDGLNQLDDLIKQRDSLLAQRDALVVVCGLIVQSAEQFAHDPDFTASHLMGAVAQIARQARTALALVKGDQKSDDATT